MQAEGTRLPDKGPTRMLLRATIAVAAIVGVFYGHRVVASPRVKLDQFMRQVSSVEVGKTKLDDFRGQMDNAGLSRSAFPCNEQGCGYALRVENTVLNKLWLAPVTVVESSVAFMDGIASERRIVVSVEARDSNGQLYADKTVVVRERATAPTACHSTYDLTVRHGYRAMQGATASLGMDPCVAPEQRKKAFAIDDACLTKLGGCKKLQEILPQAITRQ